MKSRFIGVAAGALCAAMALSGCVGAGADKSEEPDAEAITRASSCVTVVSDLSEYTVALEKSVDGMSTYNPSTMVSFHQGVVKKFSTVAADLEHDGVRDAVLGVRDASVGLVSVWEDVAENPDTWTDGSLNSEIAAANDVSFTAIAELDEMCPDTGEQVPGISSLLQE